MQQSGDDTGNHNDLLWPLVLIMGSGRGGRESGRDSRLWSGWFGNWLNLNSDSLGKKLGRPSGTGSSKGGKDNGNTNLGEHGRSSRNLGHVYTGNGVGRNFSEQWWWIVGLYMYILFIL
jgi:hypothetical protein